MSVTNKTAASRTGDGRPAISSGRLPCSGSVCVALQVEVHIAELGVDHGQALEVVTDAEFVGHAHATMQLHGLLAHEAAGLADLHLGSGRGLLALGFVLAQLQVDHVGDGHGLLMVHEHVHHAVLQHLELADGHTKLLAGLAVLDRVIDQHLHAAAGFSRQGSDALVGDELDERQAVVDVADDGVGTDLDVLEGDFRGAGAVHRRVIAGGNAGCALVHDEDGDAVGVTLAAGGAGGHNQLVSPRTGQHDGLAAVDDEAVAVLLGRRGDVGQVVAALRLGIGEGPHILTADDAGDVFFDLGSGAAAEETAGLHDRRQIGVDHQALTEFFHHQHGVDRAATEAALLFGEGSGQQAEFGDLGPRVAVPAIVGCHDLAALFELVVFLHEALDGVAQQVLFFGEGEIHRSGVLPVVQVTFFRMQGAAPKRPLPRQR